MKEIDKDMNFNMATRMATLLGISAELLLDIRDHIPESKCDKFNWLLDNINKVVYENKPISSLPRTL
jgi:hypothetical protein